MVVLVQTESATAELETSSTCSRSFGAAMAGALCALRSARSSAAAAEAAAVESMDEALPEPR